MRNWDEIAREIERELKHFESGPHGDLTLDAQRASQIALRVIQKRNPGFSNSRFVKNFMEKLNQAFEENPLQVIVLGVAILSATTKIIIAIGRARGSHAYARQVNHRIRKAK